MNEGGICSPEETLNSGDNTLANILYIVFVDGDDETIVANQKKLIRKPSHIAHMNYEAEIRYRRTLLFSSWDAKNWANFSAAVNSREFRNSIRDLQQEIAGIHGGIAKIVMRGHGSPTSYGGMSPLCVAGFLRHVGVDVCPKIALTGCSLGIGPGIDEEEITHRPASFVGLNSFAHQFQLAMFNTYTPGQQRCYQVTARTASMTVNDEGRKEIKVANGQWKNKALRDKIVFSIDHAGVQTMAYERDFDPNVSKMCSSCRAENNQNAGVCGGCGANIFFDYLADTLPGLPAYPRCLPDAPHKAARPSLRAP